MSKPTVYIETTIIGHLAGRLQTDLIVAARQVSSQKWWDTRSEYDLFVSQIVIDECSAGDPAAAAERLAWISGIPALNVLPAANALAKSLMDQHGIPATEPRDALHVAIAAVAGLEYLLTWNFRHIANASTRGVIERVCKDAGYVPPIICSPDELLGT